MLEIINNKIKAISINGPICYIQWGPIVIRGIPALFKKKQWTLPILQYFEPGIGVDTSSNTFPPFIFILLLVSNIIDLSYNAISYISSSNAKLASK